MRLDYFLLDPTGNITILVTSPVPVEKQAYAAARLMVMEQNAEQVGFLSDAPSCDIALRMAGGEFCGNAAMCSAVIAADRASLTGGKMRVRVSGAEEPVMAEVSLLKDGRWKGTVEMPRPISCMDMMLPEEGICPVVSFKGISHVIVRGEMHPQRAEMLARTWCSYLGADALGIMFLDPSAMRLKPLVCVPAAGTLCWENSCASGTAALGVYLAREEGGEARAVVRQPAGELTIHAGADGSLLLSGTVRILYRKSVEIVL